MEHKSVIRVLIVIMLMLAMQMNATLAYRTAELRRLVNATKLDVSRFVEGRQTVTSSGLELSILLEDSVVCHVGRHLFPDDMRNKGNNLVLDFIERYLLRLRFPNPVRPAANMLREDGVVFHHGSMATVDGLKPTDAFSMNMADKQYNARWMRNGKTILEISFPGEYQLITGQNLIEAEKWVEHDIKATPIDTMDAPSPVEDMLTPTSIIDYFIQKGNFYENKWINDNLYFHKQEGEFLHVAEDAFPIETLANMMLEPVAGRGYTLNIEHHLYGGKTSTFDVPLSQWVTWCKDMGCHLYFGVEEFADGRVKATVFAVNEKLNFNHLLTVHIPITLVGAREGDIEADLHCFIPTHNIHDLYSNRSGTSGYKIYDRAK